MVLEQITTDYEDDDNQQPQKGMVETEMGRMVPKAKAVRDQQRFIAAMQAQWKNRPEVIEKLKAAKLKAQMLKKKK